MYNKFHYYITEKNRSVQQKHIDKRVSCIDDIREIPAFNGCVISNELADNFPVHIVEMKDDLMEVFVNYSDGFKELLLPASEELKTYFTQQNYTFPATTAQK